MPDGLVCSDRVRLQEKINYILGGGLKDIHMLFDFDRTLTVRDTNTRDDITTWHILKEHLPREGQQVYQELFTKYRGKEIDGNMTNDHAAEWWGLILDLFVEHHLDLKAVEADLLKRANIRPGTTELFEFCKEMGVPTIIMSAGIKDVINMWDAVYKLDPTLVIATALEIDDAGRIVGWHRDTLVHALNKDEADHPELAAIRSKRPKTVLVGDSMSDKNMANGEKDVLRIRILDSRPDEVIVSAQERERTFAEFDAIIEDGSLAALGELLGQAIKSSSR